MTKTESVMYEFAQATGKIVVVGARPYDKGWFANCDGVEVDGGSASSAVKGVIEKWKQQTEARVQVAKQALRELEDQVARLEDQKS